jgi:hypothetical protein
VFSREPLPWEAAFLAGKAFLAYRRRSGRRTGVLSDFYIGAHAAVAGYRQGPAALSHRFPDVELIAP